jgi:hypothetical protein
MRAWCPRCDAVRPGATACPACGTTLATLDDTGPADHPPDLPPPEAAASPPPPRSRLRIALAAATLVVAGLAFVAGRSIARPAAPAATATPTTTTTPDPGADRRELGWTASAGGVTITALEARRLATEQRETITAITFRIRGVPGDQRVLALRGLRLLDSGGGVFATVDQRQFGSEGGAPVEAADGDAGTYQVLTGPAPRLSSLARIELTSVVAAQPRDQTITIDTSGPWPAGPRLRAVAPRGRDAVEDDLGSEGVQFKEFELRVTSAFVRDGLAVVVIDASTGFRGVPGEFLALGAELRTGRRVLCARSSLLGEDSSQQSVQGLVLSCPTRQVPELTVAVGVGARTIPLEATLRP